MNKISQKITAIGLSALIAMGSTGFAPALAEKAAENNITKDETVYVLADDYGNAERIIVSDLLRSGAAAGSIEDVSGLSDIENVKGSERFTADGENIVWQAEGSDICYQGSSERELPVGIRITYLLDGSEISAAELSGKSGHLTIRFDYENRLYEMREINGSVEKLYVPFVMLTALVLDSESCHSVSVTNARLINDGARTAVVGISFPGLQESLDIDPDLLRIPDYVQVEADVTDYEPGMTLTAASSEPLSRFHDVKMDALEDARDSVDELTEGMSELMNGSSELYDGLNTLLEKSVELSDGIKTLDDGGIELSAGAAELDSGAAALLDGAKTLDSGAAALQSGAAELDGGAAVLQAGTVELDSGAAALQDGAQQLKAGLDTLTAGSGMLNDSAAKIFDTLLAAAAEQLKNSGLSLPQLTADNYADILNDVILRSDYSGVYAQVLAQVNEAVEVNRPMAEEAVRPAVEQAITEMTAAAVKQQVRAQVIEQAAGMSAEQFDAAVQAGRIDGEQAAAIALAAEDEMTTDAVKTMLANAVSEQLESEEAAAALEAAVHSVLNRFAAAALISDDTRAVLTNVTPGVQKVLALKLSLDSFNAFCLGLMNYTNGVTAAAEGADVLYEGTVQLKDGAASLCGGAEELKAGTSALSAGAEELKSGTSALSSGAAELKNGSSALSAGASELSSGISQLQGNVPVLIDGVTQLKDGSQQLKEGLVRFNEEGIEKLVELIGSDAEGMAERLQELSELAAGFNNYSGIADGMDGSVRFIIRTGK